MVLRATGEASWSEEARQRVGQILSGVPPEMMAKVVGLMNDLGSFVQVIAKAAKAMDLPSGGVGYPPSPPLSTRCDEPRARKRDSHGAAPTASPSGRRSLTSR